jgi:hypothetical protein
MPTVVAIYFDTSSASFLFKKDKKSTVDILPFPYVYSKSLFGNQYSEKDYYQGILSAVIEDKKAKLSMCDLIISSFSNPPEISKKPKLTVGVQDLVRDCEDYFPVVISGDSFVSPNQASISSCPNNVLIKESDEQDDALENLCIYPQAIPDDISIQSDIDKKIVLGMPSGLKLDSRSNILFTGGRFFQRTFNRELDYILILELIKKPGVYNVFVDRKNAFALVQSMKMYDKSLDLNLEDYVENIGTFICGGGSVECLLKTDVGEDRFFEVEKDRVEVTPIRLESGSKLHVKSSALGSVDVHTKGGDVGLVFDTRVSKSSIYSNTRLFSECLKQFGRGFVKDKK